MILLFLSSGLFLGWSLGANDAANIFGTAVGTKMIKFTTAAIIASIFVLLGAVFAGAGASHTLGKLGAVNALAGSFTVALSAGVTVAGMTKLKLPVSTSQAIVGAIIGWNFFSGMPTDSAALIKIVSTWVICPILAAFLSIILFKLTEFIISRCHIHILMQDQITRILLFLVGAFGAYSLGANNIANVMGVFIKATPFEDLELFGSMNFTGVQQLFFLGAIAIGIGIFTYSKRVMMTVGNSLYKLSPMAAFIVVLSESLVLFLFASEGLHTWLVMHNLPTIPLVPVSSSQAVVGAVLGVALAKGGRNFKWGVLGKISSGWISTPIIASFVSLVLLYFVQNVFKHEVYEPVQISFQTSVVEKIKTEYPAFKGISKLEEKSFYSQKELKIFFQEESLNRQFYSAVFSLAKIENIYISEDLSVSDSFLRSLKRDQRVAVINLRGKIYPYRWQFKHDLEQLSESWSLENKTEIEIKKIKKKFAQLCTELKLRK